MASAIFEMSVDGGATWSDPGDPIEMPAAGGTLRCRLVSTSGLDRAVEWSSIGTHSSAVSPLTVTSTSGVYASAANFTIAPGEGQSFGIQCKVNGGATKNTDGTVRNSQWTSRSAVYVKAENDAVLFFLYETFEISDNGIVDRLNELLLGLITPVNPLDSHVLYVEDFGAVGGTTDDTAAFAAAITAAKTQGKKLYALQKKYTANISITGERVWLEGSGGAYNSSTDTVIYPATLTDPTIAIGDGTTQTRSIRVSHIRLHGNNAADKGLLINGAEQVRIHDVTARAFEEYSCAATSSASRSTSYVHFTECDFQPGTTSGSIGLSLTYGATYTTAVYFSNGALHSNTAGSKILQLSGSGMRLNMAQSWMECENNTGIDFATTGTHLACSNVKLDSPSANDVLVTIPSNSEIGTYISGTINIDGKVAMPGGNTASLTTLLGYFPYKNRLHTPMIGGSLEFVDTSLSAWLRYDTSDQPVTIYRDGSHLVLRSTVGRVDFSTEAASYARFTGGPGIQIDNGVLRFGLSADVAATGNIRAPEAWTVIGAADATGDRVIVDWAAGATGSNGDLEIGDVTNHTTRVYGGESASLLTVSDNGFEANASDTHRIINDATNQILDLDASGATNGSTVRFIARSASPDGLVTPSGADTYVCFAAGKMYLHTSGSAWDEIAVVP